MDTELTAEEREEVIKQYQADCPHNAGVVTNTGDSGSHCVICGKETT